MSRSLKKANSQYQSCSVIIPCRNEKGNIENAVLRIPNFCDDLEIIFVEGHSQDDTYEEIKRIRSKYSQKNIKVLQITRIPLSASAQTSDLDRPIP